MPKRAKYTDREHDQLDRLKYENKKLKKQLSALRKILARVDLSKFDQLQDLVEQQREEQKNAEQKKKKELAKRKCFECDDGYMELEFLHRRDGLHYYRLCHEEGCGNRTKSKLHHKGVKP